MTRDEAEARDDAARGVLLGQVRKAWGSPHVYAWWYGGRWCVRCPSSVAGCALFWGDTEAAALEAALDAAPTPGGEG